MAGKAIDVSPWATANSSDERNAGQELGVTRMSSVDRAHGVNHVARWELEAGSDSGLAGRTTDPRSDFGNRPARFEKGRARRLMDCAIDTTAAEHPFVGGIHDRVDGLSG